MVPDGAHSQRKRPRDQSSHVDDERLQTAKRHKRDSSSRSSRYPPRFWDTLSKVYLTRGALREFDRRNEQTGPLQVRKPKATSSTRLLRSDLRRLRQIASEGGPDLTSLRGYSNLSTAEITMSQSSSRSRKRRSTSGTSKSDNSGKTKTTSTTPYSREFEQKLIDRGIYPDGYRQPNGSRPLKPENISEIREILARPRPSLSPSAFSETAFEDFQDSNCRAKAESKAMANVIPVIAGSKDKQYESMGDVPFYHLKPIDPDLSAPKPDTYYGAKPAQIDPRVRRDLGGYITPSNRTNLPAAPNFFLEGKSASGRPDVAQNQALYDGAIGARGMFKLQNYGKPTPFYDGNAYTVAATYHPGTGTMQMYATHPRESTSQGGEPEYYMTQLGAYALTHSSETFRSGAAAFRNARELTQQHRDRFIAEANASAQGMSAETTSFSTGTRASNLSSVVDEDESAGSETSADELAADYHGYKRQRGPASSY